MNPPRTSEEMAAAVEKLGALHLRDDGVYLVHHDGGVFRLTSPLVKSFVIEEAWRAMPNFAAGKAIKLLADRAFDVRSPPAEAE